MSAPNSVSLPTGRVIDLRDVTIDAQAQPQQFYYGVANVTPYLSRAQKMTFGAYDVEAENARLSDEHQRAQGKEPAGVGETSATKLFLTGVGEDITGVRKFFTGEGQGAGFNFKTIFFVGLGLFGLWLVLQVVKEMPR